MRLTRKQLKTLVENYLYEQDSVMDGVDEEEETEEPATPPEAESDDENTDTPKESDSEVPEETEPEIPDEVEFKVTSDNTDSNIGLIRRKEGEVHNIYVNDKRSNSINSDIDLQVISAHGYIHKDTDEETKKILQKILSRDADFKGKNESGIIALINDKMSANLGVQSLGPDRLKDILNKG